MGFFVIVIVSAKELRGRTNQELPGPAFIEQTVDAGKLTSVGKMFAVRRDVPGSAAPDEDSADLVQTDIDLNHVPPKLFDRRRQWDEFPPHAFRGSVVAPFVVGEVDA